MSWASQVELVVKNPLAITGLARDASLWGLLLSGEDPLEEEMATHSSLLSWAIPWTEEPVGYSPRGHKSQT